MADFKEWQFQPIRSDLNLCIVWQIWPHFSLHLPLYLWKQFGRITHIVGYTVSPPIKIGTKIVVQWSLPKMTWIMSFALGVLSSSIRDRTVLSSWSRSSMFMFASRRIFTTSILPQMAASCRAVPRAVRTLMSKPVWRICATTSLQNKNNTYLIYQFKLLEFLNFVLTWAAVSHQKEQCFT